jgi:hypothetical protein
MGVVIEVFIKYPGGPCRMKDTDMRYNSSYVRKRFTSETASYGNGDGRFNFETATWIQKWF